MEVFCPGVTAETVASIDRCGKLQESQGAQCVFLEQFTGKDGDPLPVIVQKFDGGFNYETFDLAAVRYRIAELHADRLIYVTDARQALHFSQIFAVAEAYPELKTNESFMQLQGRIISLENAIADRRELYNEAVNINNVRVEQFPELIIAQAFRFDARPLLERNTANSALGMRT
jgi:hypothetical protein